MKSLSIAEKAFIVKGASEDIRADGRRRLEMRSWRLESGFITQASGSARCNLQGTEVVVGVKVEVGTSNTTASEENNMDLLVENGIEIMETPRSSLHNAGMVVCQVDSSPSLSRVSDAREIENLCIQSSEYMNRLLNSSKSGLDLQKLVIVPGVSHWILYIDVLVLDYAGNLMDAIMLATRAALINTRMPKCVVDNTGGHFEVADDETEVVPGSDNVPICVTLNEIGNQSVLDATIFEELCSEAKIIFAIDGQGSLCSITKQGNGSLAPSLLTEMMSHAPELGMQLLHQSNSLLQEEKLRNSKVKGFMA